MKPLGHADDDRVARAEGARRIRAAIQQVEDALPMLRSGTLAVDGFTALSALRRLLDQLDELGAK